MICQVFNTIWYLPNIYILIANIDFFEKSGFEFWAAIFERNRLFSRIYSRGAKQIR